MGLMDWVRPGREQVVEPIAGTADPAAQGPARLVNRLGVSGVAARAVIEGLRPTGQPDISGGQRVEVRVTITPTGGQSYPAIIMQSFLPSQMEDLSPGRTIGVRYDPEDPASAVISMP